MTDNTKQLMIALMALQLVKEEELDDLTKDWLAQAIGTVKAIIQLGGAKDEGSL